jgi:hypothetical protein
MSEFKARVLSVNVGVVGEPIFDEKSTLIAIVDEGGGEFLELTQSSDSASGSLRFDSVEWPAVREAIDQMFANISEHESFSKR